MKHLHLSETLSHIRERGSAAITRGLVRFQKREEGVAAVEFALILPIMTMMFLGTVEMSWAISVDRRVSQVASSTGDLIARVNAGITENEVKDISKVGSWLMRPYDQTKLELKLSLVMSSATSATTTTERWKCKYNSATPNAIDCTCPSPAPSYPIPLGLVTMGDSVVVADVTYKYLPVIMAFDHFMKVNAKTGGYYTLTEKLHIKPRALFPKLTLASGVVCS